VLEDRFSMVPEWLLDADIGDCAVRLYAVLLRYGNTTGARMPARSTLAARLHKKSVDTVDRALADLVRLGAVQVENRWTGGQRLTNRYRIRTSRPGGHRPGPVTAIATAPCEGGGRTDAATPTDAARGGRSNRGRVAARIGHDRESSTDTPPPPPPPAIASRGVRGVRGVRTAQYGDFSQRWRARQAGLLAACGIDGERSWHDYAARVRQTRRGAGQPLTRWSPAHLLTALDLAVRGRGWPPEQAATALQQVASDPATRSPARLAEAGPWWDRADLVDAQTADAGAPSGGAGPERRFSAQRKLAVVTRQGNRVNSSVGDFGAG